MTGWLTLLVALAGGLGSALRYLADNAVPAALRERFPWGTAVINLTGSFALGLLTGAAARLSGPLLLVLGTGLIGGYTTFSTASLDAVRLVHEGRPWTAAGYALGLLLGCVALAAVGLLLTD